MRGKEPAPPLKELTCTSVSIQVEKLALMKIEIFGYNPFFCHKSFSSLSSGNKFIHRNYFVCSMHVCKKIRDFKKLANIH